MGNGHDPHGGFSRTGTGRSLLPSFQGDAAPLLAFSTWPG